ncbi:mannitol dehydrogenase family protein [Dyella solisilvae]|uniref:Mannitol dehydrogenase family protein n=1 Tax=Dyella solisilvae TaxID=1920168 RepID=A0A370K9C1_9GAMM|nr:mannitol dehydrogenase family protein [Dyella solisilvae]RDI99253.1 mannitol dehydrogenase family protein [Dyella solisilvae]
MSKQEDAGRLSARTLDSLPSSVARPAYELERTQVGIVHIGAGAFHRAHQAVYVDDLLPTHPDWAICAVSLNSHDVRDALRPQDGLYTLALLGRETQFRVIGAIRELLCARDEGASVLSRLAEPAVRLVTLTITEKGYCLAGDDLDVAHPDIAHDLAAPATPRSAIGYLVAGLRARRDSGVAPFTVLSCDNLADNGHRLRRAVLQYATRVDAALAAWIEADVAFPCSMVDSITPATDDALRERVHTALGLADAWPIQREAYTQWVIEDRFCNERPPFEQVGATLSTDIAGYDRSKLRLLNGAHSSLAYLGSLMELDSVGDAMGNLVLAGFVEGLMREHIAPAIALPRGLEPGRYIDAILDRFRNPSIRHRLSQIAWDGSQKLPVRLLSTITESMAQGRSIEALCLPIAAWMQFVRRQAQRGVALVDPMNELLQAVGQGCNGDPLHDVPAFLALGQVFGALADSPAFATALTRAYDVLGDGSPSMVSLAVAAYADVPAAP